MENQMKSPDRSNGSPKRSPSRRSNSPDRKISRTPSKQQDLAADFPKAIEILKSQQKTYEGLLGPQICMLCNRNIGRSAKIRCAECPVNDKGPIDFCLECLLTGNESQKQQSDTSAGTVVRHPTHRKNHSYLVFDNLNFPLFDQDWTAVEELSLVQGIMKYGLGNWNDIAENFLKNKTAGQCEEHYFGNIYRTREDVKKPFQSILTERTEDNCKFDQGLASIYGEQKQDYIARKEQIRQEEELEFPAEGMQVGKCDQSVVSNGDNNANRNAGTQSQNRREGLAKQNCQEVLGYLPKRGDFEQEYDMDADLLLADMEFFDDDTPENNELKNNVIELYNARLDERIRRKKFVIERGLLDLKKQQKFERKKSKEEREIINGMKIFARFNSEEDHQRIVNSLIKERQLREVVEQLKFFRSKGLTNLDQIEKFIEIQKVRVKNQDNNHHRQGGVGNNYIQNFENLQEFMKTPDQFMGGKKAKIDNNASNIHSALLQDPKWSALNKQERDLCSTLNLRPSTYLELKRSLTMEQLRNGELIEAVLCQKAVEQATGMASYSQQQRSNEHTQQRGNVRQLKGQVPLVYQFLVQCKLLKAANEVKRSQSRIKA